METENLCATNNGEPVCSQDLEDENGKIVLVKSFKYRWLILVMYSLVVACNGGTAVAVYLISDSACKFYDVSKSTLLSATSTGNGISILGFVAATFIPSKYGLRTAVVLASGVSALGGAFLIAASHSSGFVWFFISILFLLFSTGLSTPLIAEISAVWFPAHQQSLATCLGIQMPAVGAGIISLETMLLFTKAANIQFSSFESHFNTLCYCNGGLCILFFILIMIFYKDMPKCPPSVSQAKKQGPGNISFSESLSSFRLLIKHWRFLVLANVYGICFAVGISIPLFNNNLISPRYENGDKLVGELGMIGISSGMVGTIFFGALLDKTKHFKRQSLIQLILSAGFWVGFTLMLQRVVSFYVLCIIWTFFWFVSLSTIGLMAEAIAEVTYPAPSSAPLVISSIMGTLYGVFLTQLSGLLADKHQENVICWIIAALYLFAFVLVAGVRIDQKRSAFSGSKDINVNVNGDEVVTG